MRIFIDCDVLLDVGLNREPFVEASSILIDYLEANPQKGCIAWHSLSNIYYIASKTNSKDQARDFIADLCSFLYIVPTSNQDVLKALEQSMSDFEDALQVSAALSCGAQCIITRNLDDYAQAPLPAYVPDEFIKQLSPEE
ncbi:type II toxin-antitoxin system VapC family toxin [Acaryochloris marina NIES-2412]|uniref:type II toxin-antitoxin system VapC family toxin n=1 Tax=Acaryochloris marina TaxID=155978 RepID=UPI004058A718